MTATTLDSILVYVHYCVLCDLLSINNNDRQMLGSKHPVNSTHLCFSS